MAIYVYSFWNDYSKSIKVTTVTAPRRNIDYVVYYGSRYYIERLRGTAVFYRREYHSMLPEDLDRIIENTGGGDTALNFSTCPFNTYKRRITLYTQYNINFRDKYLLSWFNTYLVAIDANTISRVLFIYLLLDRLFETYNAERRTAQLIEDRYKRHELYRAILNDKKTQARETPTYMLEY